MLVHITILRLPLVHVPSLFFPSLVFCRRSSPMLVLHFTFAYSISILLLIQLDTPMGMPHSMQSAKWKLLSSFRLDIWCDCFVFFFFFFWSSTYSFLSFFVLLCDFWCRIIMFISMNMQTDGQRKIWFSYGGPAIQCKSPTISSCHDSLSRNLKRIRVTARPIQVSSIEQARRFHEFLTML